MANSDSRVVEEITRQVPSRRPSWNKVFVILLIAYVVSIGPTAAVLGENYGNPHCMATRFWDGLYAPLLWAGEEVSPLGTALKSYIGLFVDSSRSP